MISYFLICIYLYRGRSRIVLVNLYKTKSSFSLVMLRYVIKPLIQTVIHALLYENYRNQILCISLLDFICFGCSAAFQLLVGASKAKILFVSDCLFDFSLSAINLTLYFQQAAYPELSQEFEHFIKVFLYIIVSVMTFYIVYSIMDFAKFFHTPPIIISGRKQKPSLSGLR